MQTLFEVVIETRFADGDVFKNRHFFLDVQEARKDLKQLENMYKEKGFTAIPTSKDDVTYCIYRDKINCVTYKVIRGIKYLFESVEETEHNAFVEWDGK